MAWPLAREVVRLVLSTHLVIRPSPDPPITSFHLQATTKTREKALSRKLTKTHSSPPPPHHRRRSFGRRSIILTMASKMTPFLFRLCLRAASRVARPQPRSFSISACRASDSLMVVRTRVHLARPRLPFHHSNQRFSKLSVRPGPGPGPGTL